MPGAILSTRKYDDYGRFPVQCSMFKVQWIAVDCLLDLQFSLKVALSYINLLCDAWKPHATYLVLLYIVKRLATMAASKQYRKQETASGNVLCLFGGKATLFQNT